MGSEQRGEAALCQLLPPPKSAHDQQGLVLKTLLSGESRALSSPVLPLPARGSLHSRRHRGGQRAETESARLLAWYFCQAPGPGEGRASSQLQPPRSLLPRQELINDFQAYWNTKEAEHNFTHSVCIFGKWREWFNLSLLLIFARGELTKKAPKPPHS